MNNRIWIQTVVGVMMCLSSIFTYADSIEGYWRSIDDRTGEQLTIIEIRKAPDNTYRGKIVYIYPNAQGVVVTHCVNCPAPYTGKPRLGLEVLTGLIEDPKKPDNFINGRIVESKTGKVYKGKARLTADGKRLHMRGYVGISALGRTVVWIRKDSANP
ncbi:DUF2147 domain-containing protein [Acinetobacter genomosp. 15BJ]|uniref:DUF2147 domain-containing protein n=1 Tax=Acinetobacter genomosp. 15BJ TaxID=106651 RepID=R9B3L6_9GAMM|nr:DUF2147 domain-containing protein [Acinetobacter genomosp. 15BJ]EOR09022.1 hypothetical protein F896_01556 [Acinetobacter genomosp. 15BJ]MCH7290695.1 DUF2147 domain-containing protein [Acinetobacter genomosp. 15BJ]MDO3657314.1 DUF2147 domain-containing protein [Acinetobacter genomosp. 15BJ]